MKKLVVCALVGILMAGFVWAQTNGTYAVTLTKGGEDTGIGITWQEINDIYLSQREYFAQQEGFDPVFDAIFVKFDIAENLAKDKILEIYLADHPIDIDEDVLAKRLDETILMPGDHPAVTMEWIEHEFGSMEDYVQAITDSVRKELEKEILYEEVSVVDREAMEIFFEQEKDAIAHEYDRVWVKHILVETEEEALSIKADIESEEISFDEAASLHSLDTHNKDRGGDLEWFGYGQMVEPFEKAAFASEPDSLVGPVETQFGFHILYIVDRDTLDTFEQFEDSDIFLWVQQELGQESYARFIQSYAAEHQIDFKHHGTLKALTDFISAYTMGYETGEFSHSVNFLRDYEVEIGNMDSMAFYEIAVEAVLEGVQYGMVLLSDEEYDMLISRRSENLKHLSEISEAELAALIRYWQINPDDQDMAMRLYEVYGYQLLEMTYDDFMFMNYGETIINNLVQIQPLIEEIAYDTEASSVNRLKGLILIAEIKVLIEDYDAAVEVLELALTLDSENEAVEELLAYIHDLHKTE